MPSACGSRPACAPTHAPCPAYMRRHCYSQAATDLHSCVYSQGRLELGRVTVALCLQCLRTVVTLRPRPSWARLGPAASCAARARGRARPRPPALAPGCARRAGTPAAAPQQQLVAGADNAVTSLHQATPLWHTGVDCHSSNTMTSLANARHECAAHKLCASLCEARLTDTRRPCTLVHHL